VSFQAQAERKQQMLDRATDRNELRVPQPTGETRRRSARQYSIQINDRWKVCLRWRDEGSLGRRNRRLPLKKEHDEEQDAPDRPWGGLA
jgi:plasmid maintenance system killer protein